MFDDAREYWSDPDTRKEGIKTACVLLAVVGIIVALLYFF